MSSSIDLDTVKSMCHATDRKLWNAFHNPGSHSRSDKPLSRLVFPTYRRGDIRVSEQEARFAFQESVLESGFFYSVEAPTSEKYRFTGKKSVSAQTDFALYREAKADARVLNIEFKKGVAFGSKRPPNQIYKDAQKLLREPVPGMWFHLLRSAHNKTVTTLLQKDLFSEFSKVLGEFRKEVGDKKTILFHICVLKHGFSIHKKIDFCQSPEAHRDEFAFPYKISRGHLEKQNDTNGWDIHQISDEYRN